MTPQRRRLARAGRAEEREELARADVEVDARDRDDVAVDAADAAQADRGSARGRLGLRRGRRQRRQVPPPAGRARVRAPRPIAVSGGRSRMTLPSRPHERRSKPFSNAAARRRLRRVGRRLAQLEREHRAEPAYLADERLPGRDLLEPRAQERADVLGPLGEAGRGQLVEYRERGRAGDGIAAERAAEPTDVDRVHQLRAAGHRGERKAAAERLPARRAGQARRRAARSPTSSRCARSRPAPRRRRRRSRARRRCGAAPARTPAASG